MSNEFPISARAAALKPSATLAVAARAGELRAQGKLILDFSAGEPDFKPPAAVRQAVLALVAEQRIGYAPVPGLPRLREVVAEQLSAHHGTIFSRDQVLVSCGAKHSLANLFLAALSPGDEVVIPSPYWVSYPDLVRLGDGVPVIVESRLEDGWRLRPERLEAVIGPRTRFLVLNSPGNPTGAGYGEADVRALGEVLARRAPGAWIVVDDIYRTLVYDGYVHASAFAALRGITDRIVVVDGVSKSHAMTGFRIGFLAGPKALIQAASNLQGQTTSGAATPSQHAALAALTDPSCAADLERMREAFARRRALMLEGLARVPGTRTSPPDGAFYAFTDVSAHIGGKAGFPDDIALARWLLEEKLVATVPGTEFGAPGYLRLSYATDDETIREGVARMQAAFSGAIGAAG